MSWYKVFGSVAEAEAAIPLNKSVLLQLEEHEICLSRVRQGFFAVADKCPHLGDSLSRGTCNYLGEVVCPWHSYRFSLLTGEETTGHGLMLQTFAVKITDEGLLVELPG